MDERTKYWRPAEPKPSYEVVIVGGGGHGLSTAYYLAKNHGITDICVVEKGWLAGGNKARNTTIIRSNYLWDESADIVEHSEMTGFVRGTGGRVEGVETTRGTIRANRTALVAAGHTSVLAAMVGLRLPLQSHPLQALVSALYEPILDCVVMSNAVHVYVSQADKGELVMGAGIDAYNGYAQRGSFHVIEHQMAAALELFSLFAHAALLRTWGGIVDVCPDASPIVGPTPIPGLFINCGWGTGGFKATPGSGWAFADVVATGDS